MIGLLQLLIFGHWHTWKIIETCPYSLWGREVGEGPVTRQGTQYTLQCEKCGKLKDHLS